MTAEAIVALHEREARAAEGPLTHVAGVAVGNTFEYEGRTYELGSETRWANDCAGLEVRCRPSAGGTSWFTFRHLESLLEDGSGRTRADVEAEGMASVRPGARLVGDVDDSRPWGDL